MKWKKEEMDVILVPGGLFIMCGYHIFLLYTYLTNPNRTNLGFDNHCIKAWVKKIMQIDAMNRSLAFTVISSSITAANFMASTSLTLSSLIGTWVGSSSSNQVVSKIIYGDTKPPITSIKYLTILLFFLVAFASFIQCLRCYVQANLLLTMPSAVVPEDMVVEALVHGSNFWQLGLRAIYLAITLLMWVFGPIPMFVSSVVMVVVLYVLDVNKKPFHDFDKTNLGQSSMLKKIEGEIRGNQHHEVDHAGEMQASFTTAVLSTAAAS